MKIHFIETEGELGETLAPLKDYYEDHTAESLYQLLNDMVSSDGNKAFTLKKTKQLLKKGFTCVVYVKDDMGHKIFIIPEPKRINLQ